MRNLIVLLFIVGCGSKSKPAAAPEPTPPPTTAEKCADPQPSPEHVCLQDCGPPVAKEGDPEPGWRWLSAEDAKSRQLHGCPICLPPDTLIATPDGDRPISELTAGARIYTVDETGQRSEARVIYAGATPVSGGHLMVRLALADGRSVAGSAGHPDGTGRTLGALRAGDVIDGATIVRVDVVPFRGAQTWDILPSGPTRMYIANGVVLRSSFDR